MPMFIISGIFMTVGSTLLYVYLDPSTLQGVIYGFSVITAVGTGITLQIGYVVASLKVSTEDIDDALSLQNVAQIGSTVIALVIAGQVFQATAVGNLEAVLGGKGFSGQEIHNAVAGAKSTLFEHLRGELRDQAIAGITEAMQKSFILVIVGGVTVTIAGALIKPEKLFGETITV